MIRAMSHTAPYSAGRKSAAAMSTPAGLPSSQTSAASMGTKRATAIVAAMTGTLSMMEV